MKTRLPYSLTLNPEIVGKARRIAGLVPFSRYVESLLKNEIAKTEEGRKE